MPYLVVIHEDARTYSYGPAKTRDRAEAEAARFNDAAARAGWNHTRWATVQFIAPLRTLRVGDHMPEG